jgi:hypothetical protein
MALLSRGVRKLIILLVALGMIAGVQPLPANAAVPVCSNPSITGTSGVGNTLSVTASCSNSPTSISYQWLKSASGGGTYSPIAGATANSYLVSSAEAGMFIKVSISATNADGTSATVTSSSANGPHVFIARPFVGSSTAGNSDGQGAAAQFTNIAGITSDTNYLYVADYSARLIKRVDAAGNVTTIAGSSGSTIVDGVGTAASFHSPNAIAYNAAQHSLFIKDASVIREMDLATGQVTTLQNRQEIYSVSRSGTTVTVTFAQPHGLDSTVTLAGLGAPYDGTFAGVYTASATTITFVLSNFLNVPVFYPTGATATSDLGESRTNANNWWSNYEAFEMAPDGRLYVGRSSSGSSYNTQRLLRFTRISGSIFKYERLASIGGTPCALGIVSNTEMYIGTCGNINKYSTTDDWATAIPGATIASNQNAGLVYDHGGYVNYTSNQYDVATGLTSTKFQGTTASLETWEILGTDIYVSNTLGQSSTQIYKYTGAASGVRMSGSSVSTYSVTFNANGGSGSMATQSASTQSALTANAFTHSTDTFAGWNTAANGSGTPYADQANYAFSANLVLYAQWTSGAQLQNTPVIANDSAIVTSWTQPRVTLGGTARVVLKGYQLQHVSSVQSSSGKARIVKQNDDILEVEISEVLLGLGSIRLTSPSRVLTIQDAFNVVSTETNASGMQPSKQLTISFAANASSLSAEAKRQLISQLKNIPTPKSFVITGSVATDRYSLTTRSLAMKRAKAVAAVIAQVFANTKPKLLVAEPRGQLASNDSVTVAVSLLR